MGPASHCARRCCHACQALFIPIPCPPPSREWRSDLLQVDDDTKLLDLIIADADAAASQFDATSQSRWSGYSDEVLQQLRANGLTDFRKPGRFANRFGATDKNPSFDRASPEEMFHAARTCFIGEGAIRIDDLLPSRIGNPEGFEVEGRFYTLSWLNYYCRYAYVSKFVKFDRQVIVEVGPGSGKQAEMLKKAHPDLTIVLFDLPTQIYVCNQYLSKVFEGTGLVADYRAGRQIDSFAKIERGRINILPHWKFPIVHDAEFDLLWNAASFQEMAAPTALQYLDGASRAWAMFLMYNIKYRGLGKFPGERGIISQEHIKGFREIDRTPARLALTPETWLYHDSFWTR